MTAPDRGRRPPPGTPQARVARQVEAVAPVQGEQPALLDDETGGGSAVQAGEADVDHDDARVEPRENRGRRHRVTDHDVADPVRLSRAST